MSIPAYPTYKDSGVEWLGDVPAQWAIKAFRRVIQKSLSNGIFKKKEEFGRGALLINVFDVYRHDFKVDYLSLDRVACNAAELVSYAVDAGDLFFVRSSLKYEGISVVAVADSCLEAVVYECHLIRARPNSASFDGRYGSYLFNSNTYRAIMISKAKLTTMTTIDQEAISSTLIPVPTLFEQTQIARFLDHETARIDALIEEQQRLIELLKEKRQAVISHAVTKGLDPTVPMKDSGVEWLGEVPEHWVVRKGGYIGMLFGSEAVPEDMVNESGNLPFLKVGSLSADTLSIRQWDFFVDPSIDKAYRPRSQFVVFPKRGAAIFLNKVNVVEVSALLDPNLMGWEMEAGNDAYYFANVLKCRGLAELADVSTVPQINNKHISPEKFPVPPSGEQHDIVAFLDTEVSRFDQLVTEAENGVSLLIERRSALISAAVTGKIDVRGWQPPASVQAPELAQEAV